MNIHLDAIEDREEFVSLLRDVAQHDQFALVVLGVENPGTNIRALFQEEIIVLPQAHHVHFLGRRNAAMLVASRQVEAGVEAMLEAFYSHPWVQQRPDMLLTYGWSYGPCASSHELVEAATASLLEQRLAQQITTPHEQIILDLEPERADLQRRYTTALDYKAALRDAHSDQEEAIQQEIARLTAVVDHDLSSGLTALKRAIERFSASDLALPDTVRTTLAKMDRQVSIVNIWRHTIAALGEGRLLQMQPHDLSVWLREQVPLLQQGLLLTMTIEPRLPKNLPITFDMQMLLVALTHTLRAAQAAGASWIRITVIDMEQAPDTIGLVFEDDGHPGLREQVLLSEQVGAQGALLPLAYRSLMIVRLLLQQQSIGCQCQRHGQQFRVVWTFASQVDNPHNAFMSFAELKDAVTHLEDEVALLEEHAEANAESADEIATPRADQANQLLSPYVEELERNIRVLVSQAIPLTTIPQHIRDDGYRIHNLASYCYLLVRNLVLALRGDELQIEPLDINAQIREVVNLLAHKLTHLDIRLELAAHLPTLTLSEVEFKQVFMNLIKNAAEATKGSGELDITTTHDEQQVVIQLRDTGDGIPPRYKDNIFQLNFSTKGRGTNSGVGLYAVWTIVERAGGHVCVASASRDAKGQITTWQRGFPSDDAVQWDSPGTLFHIELPIARKA